MRIDVFEKEINARPLFAFYLNVAIRSDQRLVVKIIPVMRSPLFVQNTLVEKIEKYFRRVVFTIDHICKRQSFQDSGIVFIFCQSLVGHNLRGVDVPQVKIEIAAGNGYLAGDESVNKQT